jgi:predicted ATP-binding protein involved in virulence
MHIKQFELKNIRGIEKLRVKFDKPAGWHVFIGDNGSGKSTLLRAISAAIIGKNEVKTMRVDFTTWLRTNAKSGSTKVQLDADLGLFEDVKEQINCTKQLGLKFQVVKAKGKDSSQYVELKTCNENVGEDENLGFSAAFGPFRRFTGGSREWDRFFLSNPVSAGHASLFGEDVALTESVQWLQALKFKALEGDKSANAQLDSFKQFINSSELLSHGTRLEEINSSGVYLRDGANRRIALYEMSDGFRSILSLTFELLRQMIQVHSHIYVFETLDKMTIPISGVVLIDEVDVHLHPTWQTRIGDWFVDHFPNIQFIVTTHSPIICRAAERGSVWKLSAPGSDEPSRKVKGVALNRLIYGNVLDAYGTQLFGDNTTSSDHSTKMRERLADLHQRAMDGIITDDERNEMFELRSIMPTERISA